MFDALRANFLRLLRVPHDPAPPAGAPASVRVFRASDGFYRLRLMGWGLTQVFAAVGIVFWMQMLGKFELNVEIERKAAAAAAAAPRPAASAVPTVSPTTPPAATTDPVPAPAKKKARGNRSGTGQLAQRMPWWVIPLMKIGEGFALAGFLFQLPFTYAVLRLDYEMRWYIVTDRSLRIRSGIWRLQEMTMSFANIQQVSVTRGPIQGLLKISDVRVQSAGGGSGEPGRRGSADTLHTGVFHGVDNAQEIRDLILERLRQFRATGLGDPDDAHEAHAAPATTAAEPHPALAAAQELLAEARTLHAAL